VPLGRDAAVRCARRTAALLALAALLAGAARAEVVQKGTLRVAVSGRFSPKRLPRTGAAPIAATVGGGIATVDGSLPPQLKRLRIELNRHGRLETQGLPECRIGQIQPASTSRALSACRPALVGRGSFSVDVVLGSQEPYPTKGRLLVFNGTYDGRPALLGQIYSAHPFANSFVIPFQVSRLKRGPYGIALTARLPRAFTAWGYVTGLKMTLSRRYSYRGQRHSFISAGCPAPKGFSGSVFTLARTTFGFAGATKLSSTLTSECTVRE
jgi:hypothetical protein